MPLPIQGIGYVHTAISVAAIPVAVTALAKDGHILPVSRLGKLYVLFTFVACVTALMIFRHGHFGPGHVLAILALLCLGGSLFLEKTKAPQKFWRYGQTVLMTASLLFSLIPATIETLTRLPVGSPFASGVEDPLTQKALKTLFAVFALIFVTQLWSIKKKSKRV